MKVRTKKALAFMLTIIMVVTMMPVTAFAIDSASSHENHPACGSGVSCGNPDHSEDHGTVVYEPLSEALTYDSETDTYSGEITTSGSFYLDKDIVLSEEIIFNDVDANNIATINICLNGHTISNESDRVFKLGYAEVNICDCSDAEYYGYWDDTTYTISKDIPDVPSYDTMTGGIITGISSNFGGGIVVLNENAVLNMYGGNVAGCSATEGGGGVSVGRAGGVQIGNTGGTFNMYGGSITGNIATATSSNKGKGGGVYEYYSDNATTFNMHGGTIRNNRANSGGGVYADGNNSSSSYSQFNMYAGEIINNNASEKYSTSSNTYGGGVTIYGNYAVGSLSGSAKISSNSAIMGGGIYVYSNSTLNMTGDDVLITGNKAEQGGGVYSGDRAKFNMNRGKITGNTATATEKRKHALGGGVYSHSTFRMSGGEISKNNAAATGSNSDTYGGGIYVGYGNFIMSGGAITENTVSGQNNRGAGIYLNSDANAELSGEPMIYSNKRAVTSTIADNLFLCNYSGGLIEKAVKLTGSLGENAVVRVMIYMYPGGSTTPVVTVAQGDGSYVPTLSDALKFASDNNGFYADYNAEDNTVFVTKGDPPHRHDVSVDCGTSSPVAFTALTSGTTSLGSSGTVTNYYLSENVSNTASITINGTVNICLNGNKLEYTGTAKNSVIKVNEDAVLNICDCNGSNGSHNITSPVTNETVTITGGLITGGTGTQIWPNYYGGGIFNKGTVNMHGGTIAGNNVNYSGGGVYSDNASVFNAFGGRICHNMAEKYNGGGIYIKPDSSGNINNLTIDFNKAKWSGGIFVDGNVAFSLEDSVIASNSAVYYGGVYIMASDATVRNTKIINNTATSAYGGLLFDYDLAISGEMIVTGNKLNEENSNIEIALRSLIIDGEVTGEIGVALRYDDDADNPVAVPGGVNLTSLAGKEGLFTPDKSGYFIVENEGSLYLTKCSILVQPSASAPAIVVNNAGSASYQWYVETESGGTTTYTAVSGETSATLGSVAGVKYICVVTYDDGAVLTSDPVYFVVPEYTVEFDANGGNGEMADQIINVGEATALSKNIFTRTGYSFAGWATSENGETAYSDKQSVTNIATSGAIITLYAKWTAIPAEAPTIETQPQGFYEENALVYGNINNQLSVTSSIGSGYEVTYKWYKNTENSTETAIEVAGGTSANLVIDSNLDAGDYYYYCEITVTRTDNGESASVDTDLVKVTVAKKPVEISWSEASFVYDGTVKSVSASVANKVNGDSVDVTLGGTVSATAKGTYTATVTNVSNPNYTTIGGVNINKEWAISEGANSWTSALAITGWTYGDTPDNPSATAKFGTAEFTYSDSVDGSYSPTVPVNAGTWYVKATVPGTADYAELNDIKLFVIAPKPISPEIVVTAPVAKAVPQTTASGVGYTATIGWEPAVTEKFAYNTTYTAIVTITPDSNYTTTGISENAFVVSGAAVTNDADSNIVVAVFPATEKAPKKPGKPSGSTEVTPEPVPDDTMAKVDNCMGDATCPVTGFTDTDSEAWYHDGVHYAVAKGIMKGVDNNKFEPFAKTDRATIVTVLYRLEGYPEVKTRGSFDDVKAGLWYSDASEWAASNEIVLGYGDDTYGPDDVVTRQQMAAIFYRYAKYKGIDVNADMSIGQYIDVEKISGYAYDAMNWTVDTGLINGTSTYYLDPLEDSNRAQIATIFMRYCENIATF
ncbi:MAG: S-layer homology domain-containing protein [Firmicutes bacterium]|nr:S-layer homology domain-containing protein [Bacillota bacterium]